MFSGVSTCLVVSFSISLTEANNLCTNKGVYIFLYHDLSLPAAQHHVKLNFSCCLQHWKGLLYHHRPDENRLLSRKHREDNNKRGTEEHHLPVKPKDLGKMQEKTSTQS